MYLCIYVCPESGASESVTGCVRETIALSCLPRNCIYAFVWVFRVFMYLCIYVCPESGASESVTGCVRETIALSLACLRIVFVCLIICVFVCLCVHVFVYSCICVFVYLCVS